MAPGDRSGRAPGEPQGGTAEPGPGSGSTRAGAPPGRGDAPARRRPSRIASADLLRFAVVYAVLVAPWPGLESAYGSLLRGFGDVAAGLPFLLLTGGGATFRPLPASGSPFDTRVVLTRRGEAGGRIVLVNSRGKGWLPTAMLLALLAAAPIGWRRRARAAPWALLALYAFIALRLLLMLLAAVANKPEGLSLLSLGPTSHTLLELSVDVFAKGYLMSFAVPVLIAAATCLRAGDPRRGQAGEPGGDGTESRPRTGAAGQESEGGPAEATPKTTAGSLAGKGRAEAVGDGEERP